MMPLNRLKVAVFFGVCLTGFLVDTARAQKLPSLEEGTGENYSCPSDPSRFEGVFKNELDSLKRDEAIYLEDYRALQLDPLMNDDFGDEVVRAAKISLSAVGELAASPFVVSGKIIYSLFHFHFENPVKVISEARERRIENLNSRIRNIYLSDQDEREREAYWKSRMEARKRELNQRRAVLLNKLSVCVGAYEFIQAEGYKDGKELLQRESMGVALEFANRHFPSSLAH